MRLSEAQGDRAERALRRRLVDVHKGDVDALARELHQLAPTLRGVFSGAVLCPAVVASALARALGCSMEALLAGPREEAAALAREAGIPARAIDRVLAEEEPVGYRPPLWYVDRMRAVAKLGDGSGEIDAHGPQSYRTG